MMFSTHKIMEKNLFLNSEKTKTVQKPKISGYCLKMLNISDNIHNIRILSGYWKYPDIQTQPDKIMDKIFCKIFDRIKYRINILAENEPDISDIYRIKKYPAHHYYQRMMWVALENWSHSLADLY